MKKYCEKEQALIAALRSGSSHDELLVHVSQCPFCSEVLLVAESLQEDAAFARDGQLIPDPARIWHHAQGVVKKNTIEKATLPIRIARTLACVTAVAVFAWLALLLRNLPLPILGLKHFALLDRSWSAALTSSTFLGLVVTLLCTGLSSWYMLRDE